MAGDTMNKALISLALPLLALLTACNMGAGGNASSGESEQGNHKRHTGCKDCFEHDNQNNGCNDNAEDFAYS